MRDEHKALIRLRDARQWSRVRIEELGLLDVDDVEILGHEIIVLGDKESLGTFMRDPETGKRIKGFKVWSSVKGIWILGGDTKVREVSPPRPAGHPQEIAKRAEDGTVIVQSNEGAVQWQNDTHPFIWECSDLYSAVVPLEPAEFAVETLLYAIPVAPDEVLPVLHAALARSYDDLLEEYEEFDDGPAPTWDKQGYLQKGR